MKIGYFLSCEENDPRALDPARPSRPRRPGFHALWISDHYHPWNDEQGHSAFVWSVIGALAEVTDAAGHDRRDVPDDAHPPGDHRPGGGDQRGAARGPLQPRRRHAARRSTSTSSATHWPEADVRLEMLEEAVEVMRPLWEGGQRSHRGRHYTVENARVYDLPGGAACRCSCRASGRRRSRSPAQDRRRLRDDVAGQGVRSSSYRDEGGTGPVHSGHEGLLHGRPRRRRARPCMRLWPNEALPGELAQILPTPVALRAGVRARDARQADDADRARTSTRTSSRCASTSEAGVDELYVQQVGPDKDAFFAEWAPRVLRRFFGLIARPAGIEPSGSRTGGFLNA